MMSAVTASPRVNFKNIALPASHGGWGFLLEPIVLGLWVAPSLAGFWLGVAALGVFLAQQPLKLALTDRRKKRRYPRSVWAERFAALYLAIGAVGLVIALFSAAQPFWLPIVLALPLALVQLYYDAQNRGREFIPELFGAGALSAVASAVALAAGWSIAPALALWAILLARAFGSIAYVRARLRLERGQAISKMPVWAAHIAGLAAVMALAVLGPAPWLATLALAVLLARAIVGLSAYRRQVVPKTVGFQEMGYGLLTVALTAVGYTLGL
jgi:hypothetical protein